MPFNWSNRSHTALLSEAAQEDIILHCRHPEQDAEFAAKYAVTVACIRNYRVGKAGRAVAERLIEEDRLKPRWGP